jgi:hypothetical protein
MTRVQGFVGGTGNLALPHPVANICIPPAAAYRPAYTQWQGSDEREGRGREETE